MKFTIDSQYWCLGGLIYNYNDELFIVIIIYTRLHAV